MSQRSGWDRERESWERAAKKGPWSLLFKFFVICALLGLAFGAYGLVCGTVKETAQVAREEFGPRALLQKYELFKDMYAQCEKQIANIKVYKGKISQLENDYEGIPRKDWDRIDKQILSQWRSELDGVKASYNKLAAKYNSQMAKFNWRFTNAGGLPKGASEPLPREVAPYVEE